MSFAFHSYLFCQPSAFFDPWDHGVMATTRLLTERTTVSAPFANSTVNRESGTISNVLVCGRESANKRSYPWGKGLTHRHGTYEGKFVNCDHGKESTVDRRLGWLTNERTDEQGRPRADLHILLTHPMADRVFEAAERNPRMFGLSHVAHCKTRWHAGVEIIEDVQSVESVDLVADPATTKGFHESRSGVTRMITIRKLMEKLAPKLEVGQLLKLKRLSEDFGDTTMEEPMDMTDDTAGDDGILSAFKAAIMSIVDDALLAEGGDGKDALRKIKKLADSYRDINGDGKVDDADMPADDTLEARKPSSGALLEALDLADGIGYRPDKAELQILASAPKTMRESMAKKFQSMSKLSESSGPRSLPRGVVLNPVLTESKKKFGDDPSTWLD